MKQKIRFCSGGDRFLDYVVLDQDEVQDSFDENVLSAYNDSIVVVSINNGEFVGIPPETEVEVLPK